MSTVWRHLDGLRLVRATLASDRIVLEVAARRSSARCSSCGHRSRRVHSRYVRRLADEPIGSRSAAGAMDTPDCRAAYEKLKAKGVTFVPEPAERPYGIEAVFRDDSGNWFSLTQRATPPTAAAGDMPV